MKRPLHYLVAAAVAIAAYGCSRDTGTPVAPLAPEVASAPDSLGDLVFPGTPQHPLFALSWSAHTNALYFIENGAGLTELYVDSGADRTLATDAVWLTMSPNGRALYYRARLADGTTPLLRRFNLDTDESTTISDQIFSIPVPSYGDDVIAYSRPGDYALKIVDSDGSSDDVVAPRGFPLTFSPDDRGILYSMHPSLHPMLNHHPLQAQDRATGVVREVAIDVPGFPVGRPFWGADGIAIAFSKPGSREMWVRVGSADRLMYGGADCIDEPSLSWSADGSRLAFLTNGYNGRERFVTAWVIDLATSRLYRVAHGFDRLLGSGSIYALPEALPSNSIAFSPDGLSLAYTTNGRIFIAPID